MRRLPMTILLGLLACSNGGGSSSSSGTGTKSGTSTATSTGTGSATGTGTGTSTTETGTSTATATSTATGVATCHVGCTGMGPDQEVVLACQSFTDQASCNAYEGPAFPYRCEWGAYTECLAP